LWREEKTNHLRHCQKDLVERGENKSSNALPKNTARKN
jgi:hypothetical protein